MGIVERIGTGQGLAGRPELDLSVPLFSGIRLGDPIELVSRLGLPSNPGALQEGRFEFVRAGFEIGVTDGRVDSFCFFFAAPDRAGFAPFAGRIFDPRTGSELDARSGESECVGILGAPYHRDVDDDELLVFWERGATEIQAEFSQSGGLRALTVVTPPLLADPEQRRAYGITRPWPPPPVT